MDSKGFIVENVKYGWPEIEGLVPVVLYFLKKKTVLM